MNQQRAKWETDWLTVTQIYVASVAEWVDCHLASQRTCACCCGAFVRGSREFWESLIWSILPQSTDVQLKFQSQK